MVTRVVMIGMVGAAIAVAAISGCSGTSSTKTSSTSSTSGSASAGPTAVIVDGQNQNVSGAVSCTAADANTNVAIGDATTGVGAVLSNDSPPAVHSVGLGSVNGVTLGYSDAAPSQGNASATKSGSTYKITGTAVGLDTSSQQPVTKSFELDFTCP
jgi:lipoprotein LpqH